MSAARKRPGRCACAPSGSALPMRRSELASATSVRDILTTLGQEQAACAAGDRFDPDDAFRHDRRRAGHGQPGARLRVRADPLRQGKRHRAGAGRAMSPRTAPSPGPRVLEHMVDVVMSFEGERSHQYRILRALKNRFGAVDEIGVFAMAGQGLEEVANPSSLFLSGREEPIAGQRGVPGAGRHAAGAGRDPGADRAAAIGRDAAPRGGGLGQRPARDAAGGAGIALRAQFLLGRSLSQRRRAAIACPIRRPTWPWPRRWSPRWPTSRCRRAAPGSAKSRSPAKSARLRMPACACAKRPSWASMTRYRAGGCRRRCRRLALRRIWPACRSSLTG